MTPYIFMFVILFEVDSTVIGMPTLTAWVASLVVVRGVASYFIQHCKLFNVFHILCCRQILQHLIQQLHNWQQNIFSHSAVCLLHVWALMWPFPRKSPSKEYNGRSIWRCTYVKSKMQCCPLKLLKVFKIQINYRYFSLVCYIACEHVSVIAG